MIKSEKTKDTVLYSIFYCFKLTGIATMKIQYHKSTWIYKTQKPKWSFVSSKIIILYNICLICSLIGMHYFTYEDTLKSGFGGRFDKDKVVIAIFDSLIVLTAVIIMGFYTLMQKKFVVIANKIHKTKDSNDLPICVKKQYLTLCFGNIFLYFFITISFALNQESFHVIYTIAFRTCIFIINSFLIQYSMMIKLVQSFFEFINKNLLELSDKYFEHKRIKTIENSNLKSELDYLMRLYPVISNLSREISNFYSLPVLWSLLAIFVDVLMCLYHLIKTLIISNDILTALNLHDLSHVSYHFILVSVLTDSVNSTIEEVKFYMKKLYKTIIFIK